jgi:outer membrane protein
MKKIVLISILPLLLSAGNLGALLDMAQNNSHVEASRFALEASKEKESSIKSGYLPSLSIGAAKTYNEKENMSAPQNATSGQAILSFTLYDGGRREALIDGQAALVKSASFSLASTQNSVSLNVIYAYYTYLSTKASQEALMQKMQQLEAERYRLEKFLSVGSATGDEVQKIISTIEQTKVELLNTQNALANTLNTLEYLTGKPVNVEEGSHVALASGALASKRLDLLALEQSVESMKHQASAAKAPSLPTVKIEDTYTRYDYDFDNKAYDSDVNRQNTIALSVQWKIFDFGSTSSAYEAAQKEYLSKNSELSYEQSRANASLKNAQNTYQSALAKIEAAKARLHASSMTYELVQKKFQQGIVNNVTYLDALSDKYNATSALHSALYDVEYQKAVMLYEMGHEIKGAIQ